MAACGGRLQHDGLRIGGNDPPILHTQLRDRQRGAIRIETIFGFARHEKQPADASAMNHARSCRPGSRSAGDQWALPARATQTATCSGVKPGGVKLAVIRAHATWRPGCRRPHGRRTGSPHRGSAASSFDHIEQQVVLAGKTGSRSGAGESGPLADRCGGDGVRSRAWRCRGIAASIRSRRRRSSAMRDGLRFCGSLTVAPDTGLRTCGDRHVTGRFTVICMLGALGLRASCRADRSGNSSRQDRP